MWLGVLKVWGSGLETLLPCSKGSAAKGTSCYKNLGNKGNSKCFVFIQVMAGDCFTGYSAPFFPSSTLTLYLQLLHKAWLMKLPHFPLLAKESSGTSMLFPQ